MTRQEIEKRLEENSRKQFLIQMVDRWTEKEKTAIKKLWAEERELKEMLQNAWKKSK